MYKYLLLDRIGFFNPCERSELVTLLGEELVEVLEDRAIKKGESKINGGCVSYTV